MAAWVRSCGNTGPATFFCQRCVCFLGGALQDQQSVGVVHYRIFDVLGRAYINMVERLQSPRAIGRR